jgi:RNA polymerase sigma-70 factor (ECF subfamily)
MGTRKELFTQAYEEHGDAIFRYCYFRISDREKALDFVQEAYVRLWQYLENGNEVLNLKTFLYTIARNIIIDEYRKKKPVSLDLLFEQGIELSSEPKEELYSSHDIEHVMKHVHQLPEAYSTIITLRYVNDLSISEIAAIVEESENVVSVRINRGILKLRELIIV